MAERPRQSVPKDIRARGEHKAQIAPGTPQVVVDFFTDGHKFRALNYTSNAEWDAIKTYYNSPLLLKGISGSVTRDIFLGRLRGGMQVVRKHFPETISAKYPDTDEWYLKPFDIGIEHYKEAGSLLKKIEAIGIETAKETEKWSLVIARDVPTHIDRALRDSQKQGGFVQLSGIDQRVLNRYYKIRRIGHNKYEPGFSIEVDIDDPKQRTLFKNLLRGALFALYTSLNSQPNVDDPWDPANETAHLKRVDTNPISQGMHRKWKDSEYQSAHTNPKSDQHKERIRQGVLEAYSNDPTIITRIFETTKDNYTPEELSKKASLARLDFLDRHPEAKQESLKYLEKARAARKTAKKAAQEAAAQESAQDES